MLNKEALHQLYAQCKNINFDDSYDLIATFWKKHLLLFFLLVISILLNGCEKDANRDWNQKINSVYKAYTGANDGDVTDELDKLDAREMNILFDSILSESNGVSTSALLNIDAYFGDNSFVFSKKSVDKGPSF